MQLTVVPNVSSSFVDISEYLDNEQKDILSNEELLINERLDLLDKYFDFPLYYRQDIHLYSHRKVILLKRHSRLNALLSY